MTEKQRYFIELSFDGTNYHGWQIQKNATSVQEVLNEKLSVILREPIETTGCGRTDTGVHAKEFFAHFDAGGKSIVHSPWSMEEISSGKAIVSRKIAASMDYGPSTMDYKIAASMDHGLSTMDYLRSLNSILPKDIAVKRIFPVAADAHARFDAKQRTYEYHIHFNKDPFKTGYSWELRDEPDLDLMNKAAGIVMEYTDFSCFSKSNTQVKTNICKITKAEWLVNGDGIIFTISADRFLRNMVRAIVGTLLLVGRKEIEAEAVHDIIKSKNRSNAGMSVPACGLYLTEIKY
ncbi:MAG TPA: tRNA pseudouridine(38-40) synthase TruA [Mucilaginibacter sp.]